MVKPLISAVFFFLLGIIFTTFLFFQSNPISEIRIGERIHFSTKNGEFKYTCIPTKGRGVETLENSFTEFKKENPVHQTLKLYRTSHKNYLNIKKWSDYKYRHEWQYPHIIWSSFQ